MTKKCANRGCQKYARGTKWCATHAGNEVHKKARTNKPRVKTHEASKRKGYFRSYTLTEGAFLPLQAFLKSDGFPDVEEDSTKRGVRRLFEFSGAQRGILDPHLEAITSLATTEIHFPLKRWKIEVPALLVAPANSSLSNSWSRGRLHRDFIDEKITGVYTFMLFVDAVTSTNGCIEFWPNSQSVVLDPKNPERAIATRGLSKELVVRAAATVMAWDARILHRSLPNSTQDRRISLIWTVTSLDVTKITLA
jgi:hypothetical protein